MDFATASGRFFAGEVNPELELYYRYLPAGPERFTARPWLGAPPMDRNVRSTFPFRAMKLYPFAGDSAAEIDLRLRAQADEKDLQYAAALVKVRDSLRSDKIAGEKRPVSAAA